MKKQFLVIAGFVILAAGIWFVKNGSVDMKNPETHQDEQVDFSQSDDPALSSDAKKAKEPSPKTTGNNKAVEPEAVPQEYTQRYSQKFSDNIRFMKQMRNKPFMSDREKEEYSEKFTKAAIEEVGKLLVTPEASVSPEKISVHHYAVEFLRESLKRQPAMAISVIQKVITDKSLSNKSLAKVSRELMAKDKAELMFHTLAESEALDKSIVVSALDAPTSKIYQNVEREHKLNEKESAKQVDKYNKGLFW